MIERKENKKKEEDYNCVNVKKYTVRQVIAKPQRDGLETKKGANEENGRKNYKYKKTALC